MMRSTVITLLILASVFLIGCSTADGTPYVPDDPPTQEEVEHLVGDWSGLSETTDGLLDKLDIQFYEYNDNVNATFYLNDTYIDDVYVDYDGDYLWFSSGNIFGEYGEFEGLINHTELVITGSFFYQSGLSYTEGTFEISKMRFDAMNRDEAVLYVRENIKNENLVKHMLAAEAVMRGLAAELNQDVERWGLAGLLHDVDLGVVGDDMTRHSILSSEMIKEKGMDDEIVNAVAAHNEAHGLPRETLMAKALYACDPLTGFITATALVRPDKKIASVEVKSIRKRFKETRFAANASREQMFTCEPELGIPIERFVEIALVSMQGVADDLGL